MCSGGARGDRHSEEPVCSTALYCGERSEIQLSSSGSLCREGWLGTCGVTRLCYRSPCSLFRAVSRTLFKIACIPQHIAGFSETRCGSVLMGIPSCIMLHCSVSSSHIFHFNYLVLNAAEVGHIKVRVLDWLFAFNELGGSLICWLAFPGLCQRLLTERED